MSIPPPPVFYFLIQVRFNRVMQMHQHVAAFQESMRLAGYADYDEQTQLEITWQQVAGIQPSIQEQQKKRWLFNNMKKTAGFVLLDDALVYHTTAYTSYSACKAEVSQALSLLHNELNLNFVQRIGMRYLDCISSDDVTGLGAWVQAGLLGLADGIPGRLRHAYSETVSSVDGLTLVLKSLVSPDQLILPPDLQIGLSLPDDLKRPGVPRVLMDSDCFIEERFAFDMAGIHDQLDALHNRLLGVFKQATTEQGRQTWHL